MASQTGLLVLLLICCTIKAAVAQSCLSSGSSVTTADITGLIGVLNSGNYDYADPFPVKPSGDVTFTEASAVFCVENTNSGTFDGTSATLAEVANAASSVQSQCCTSSTCQGGFISFTPDYGPNLLLTVAATDFNCY